MKLLISGEGSSDLGACNNAQGQCSDEFFDPGPMTVWLARLWESSHNYNLLDFPEAVLFVSETALEQQSKREGKDKVKRMQLLRGKDKPVETGVHFNNARQLGLMAKQLAADAKTPVMAVFFRDTDGTRSAPGQLWQTKWDSILNGFSAAAFDFGVPMLPKPKSEAWLLCAGKTARHSHEGLEAISGNDDSPHSAKTQLDEFFGSHQAAHQLADWCQENPADWSNLLTMPSFKKFFARFQEVATSLLRPKGAAA
jgi:hypothetical protein